MATPAHRIPALRIPHRSPTGTGSGDALVARLMLAERISELEGIETTEDSRSTLPCYVKVFVRPPAVSERKQRPPQLLCSMTHDAIRVRGVDEPFGKRVAEHGWGSMNDDSISLYMPRDIIELDVCLRVVEHAHTRIVRSATSAAPVRTSPWPDYLPRFSRTRLQ